MPLELLKTILAGIAVLLALLQALVMLQVRGKFKVFPGSIRSLIRFHKWGGRVTLALVTIVGLICLFLVFGLGYATGSVHVRSHAILGSLAGLILAAKVVVAARRRAYLRHALPLGLSAAAALALAFGASGLVYLLNR